jgi:hypothetical protein
MNFMCLDIHSNLNFYESFHIQGYNIYLDRMIGNKKTPKGFLGV